MTSIQKGSNPLDGLNEKEIKELVKQNDDLDQEEERIVQEEIEDRKRREVEQYEKRKPFNRLRKSPLEIINRILLLLFLSSFIISFVFVYSISLWWFLLYIISAFSCLLYTPNRKALKELMDAWPNIVWFIKNRIR